ncbi:endoplasmic reticulum resident protein 44-like [Mizuhopecten yessoensis]|uniref:Endoplasmic reticulum resident protein 44 n=1 Tax=Mizuhopecten yessoensis TaxID=6573 RepID=A0A210QS50_MIZYE|nr:endoplasmic reticulum resident protein 44-like [Mizuhopecten yessoensis]OWF51555.1 Endoplasmic reticulum resident protein 44 [Mizuhopecten yessoensis]
MNLRKGAMSVFHSLVYAVLTGFLVSPGRGDVISLVSSNMNTILSTNDVVFVNFYADWCRFSQILTPIFLETSNKIKEEFPQSGRVVFGKVDADRESTIAAENHISKYPTLKLYRNGQVIKKEYRGQRTADALANYIREQLKDPIQQHTTLQSLDELDDNKRHIIGYFGNQESEPYKTYMKVTTTLRDECNFHAVLGPASESERLGGDNVVYRAPKTIRQDVKYPGALNNYEELLQWITERCMPLVREITFENAEELTEEGIPFLILFHHPDDRAIVEKFSNVVNQELLGERTSVNFLTADGLKFSHPLHHLGKSTSDLPVLAIDSFRHMYVFPKNTNEMDQPGVLKQFIQDLHSGKLHREFHHGPDPTTTGAQNNDEVDAAAQTDHIPHDASDKDGEVKSPTSPPESTFKKLAPSENRYTILHKDEL